MKPYGYNPLQSDMDDVIAYIKKQPKKPASTIQQPSTQAILDRPKEMDIVAQGRELPLIAQLRRLDGSINVGDLNRDPQQVSIVQFNRSRSKNTIGQSEELGTSILKKNLATQAFMFSPGTKYEDLTKEQKAKIIELFPYTPPEKIIEKVKDSEWTKWEWVMYGVSVSAVLGAIIFVAFFGYYLLQTGKA